MAKPYRVGLFVRSNNAVMRTLPYLDVDLDSLDDDFVRASRHRPVFKVQPVVQS